MEILLLLALRIEEILCFIDRNNKYIVMILFFIISIEIALLIKRSFKNG